MATLSDAPMDVNWEADGARVAASGDLGFTWGIMRPGGEQAAGQPPALFPFFAVWRRAGPGESWRYIAR
jgi:ketosteroid isomerase-like protein